MMDSIPLDPYEQQLLKVFDSYDYENCGSLDKHGLTQLCQTLQLEEQASDLIRCLLKDPKCSRATFTEFKEALLALLGNMQNKKQNNDELTPKKEITTTDKGSPEREVSPKFVFGSKKYGRRSRPRSEDINAIISEQNDMNSINKSTNNVSVQRSNSQSEVSNSKKRKPNYKLKRCTSLPGNNDFVNHRNYGSGFITSHTLSSEPEFVCTEEMLKEAWEKLGVGKDGYLNQTELILVCDAIGLQKLANGVIRQLSNKLTLEYDHKISFQELLEALQQDETWSDVLNSTPNNLEETLSTTLTTENSFPDSRAFQFVTLGPEGNGSISTDLVIEMWETAGVTSPKELLHELGFNSHTINIIDLAKVLEKEVKGISENRRLEYSNPHITLLQANIALYQSEIRCLKNILEQMQAEREKLKCDVSEANNRATLLAQEVDDNHIKMEQNTQNQVKLMEQRHNDILKGLTQQFSTEKEHVVLINQSLEDKISCLEQETDKLKNELQVAQKYSCNVEKENHMLASQISELQQVKEVLTKQIEVLETDKQNYGEMEREQMEPLLSKLSNLQIENAQLRDRIDEMVSEIESLTNQVSTMRAKVSSTPTFNTLDQSMEENISIICEGVGLGSKRRSDYSPTKDNILFSITDGSPRLGKVRKFHRNKGDNLDVPFTSSESGFDTEVDCFDSSISTNENDEITRLQAKIQFLEQVLVQHSIPIPTNSDLEAATSTNATVIILSQRVNDLEKALSEAKHSMMKMIDTNCVNKDTLNCINKLENILQNMKDSFDSTIDINKNDTIHANKLSMDVCTETENNYLSLEDKVKWYEEENKDLSAKCCELENCVELLKNEYERCEDYWASKLDEERQMFAQKQSQSDDRVTDLLNKVAEYEEHLASQDNVDNSRLPTIQETYNLEKQFTDLEQEFEDYKTQSELEISKKDEEISALSQKLNEIALKSYSQDIAVQVDDISEYVRISNKMKSLTNHVAECTNLFSTDTTPVGWDDHLALGQCQQNSTEQEFGPQSFMWNKDLQNQKTKRENLSTSSSSLHVSWPPNTPEELKSQSTSLTNVPSTSSSSTDKSTTPCRPKRTRKHERSNSLYKKSNQEKETRKTEESAHCSSGWKGIADFKNCREQTVMVPVSSIHNLNGRLHHLEQRCRHLQMVIKQHHFYSEQALQQCMQQYKGEKLELHYLLKNNQERLEQQIRVCNDQLERLTKSDMLVKELYVENSYLIATVQRLQQQCDMLAQCRPKIVHKIYIINSPKNEESLKTS